MRYRPKHVIEYGALRALGWLVQWLPNRAALSIGWGAAAISFFLIRFRVHTAMSRIRHVVGDDVPEREIRRIAWVSFRNLCFNVIEILRMPRLTPERISAIADVEAIPRFKELKGGNGAVLAVPHMGNWDMGGVASEIMGIPVFFMARRQKNPLVDAYLNRMRGVTGVETIPTDSRSLRTILRNLKNGKVFAILPDVRARTGGVPIRFFNGTAYLPPGMASFARHAGVPVIPATLSRSGWTRHRWRVHDPIVPDPAMEKDQDERRILQLVMDIFDRAVREQPEQYFWYNKRWILDPPDSMNDDDGSDPIPENSRPV